MRQTPLDMTRINVGLRPKEIPTKVLMAEHRELKRIPNSIKKGNCKLEDIPTHFTLGTGHVRFFYDKLKYLWHRYREIHEELKERGCNVQDYSDAWIGIPKGLYNDYQERPEDRVILLRRFKERGHKLLS